MTKIKKQVTKRLSERHEDMYLQRRKLKLRINKLEKTIRNLKEQRDGLDEELVPIFQECERRKLSDGKTIVLFRMDGRDARLVTKDMKVGDVITPACEWPVFVEMVND